jgi:hypothetical protein
MCKKDQREKQQKILNILIEAFQIKKDTKWDYQPLTQSLKPLQ